MPRYAYTYLDSREKKRRSFLEAAHLQEAQEKLMQQGVQVLGIREAPPSRIRIKNTELIVLTKQLALLLRSGLPLYESLASLRDQYQGQGIATLLSSFMDVLRSGGALSEAMAVHPEIFDNFYCSAVIAGENVGALEECLNNVVTVLEERAHISKKLLAALSYPLILLSFSIMVILFFLLGVIPSLRESFENIEPNRLTTIVFGLSECLCTYKLTIALGLGGGIGIGMAFRRKIPWKRFFEKCCFAFPFVKKFLVKVALIRFCSVASAILKGGGTLIEGLELGYGAIPYEGIRDEMKLMVQAVTQGSSLSEEFAQRPWVPKLALGMVSLGEESGELAEVLGYVARMYNEDVQKTLSCLTSWCQPVILILLGGIIGVIMLAILIPLTSNIQAL
ncbi:type II secretion system F family protein [Chlamydia pecorum]|uniref:type II secretion system F family protein n=1 Tax=Chlamydia pecorum TaxID=85991 RepID=UPI0003AE4D67|nr:type II secretion system F family protein [Chlamydia pecorum]AGW38373.1 general secretion pathway protein F [Chlamydia pecorum PV3056/3]AGW39298.1 general secretion pathway protein F [Chlamydia pecorum W73]AGW40223.1 general secretion pathway protein F [Chlamydia pecorum P787]ETF39100.1 general secretion pathway protein F [Chlamydia pecorum DBDeUG]ETF39776.1 general secretion pathway protein F [Chlamydia pecorum MC/MarsBar]